jgi:hypothetical protein
LGVPDISGSQIPGNLSSPGKTGPARNRIPFFLQGAIMNKLPYLTLAALFLASGAAVAGDHGDHWGGHHRHHRHHAPPPHYYPEHHHHYQPSYSYYYYDPPPVYYAPRYYNPGYNTYFQSPNYDGFRFGFSGTWNDR